MFGASGLSAWKASAVFLFLVVWATGCGLNYTSGERLGGQECFVDDDCIAGTSCVQRRCRPILEGAGEMDPGGEGDVFDEDRAGGDLDEEVDGDREDVDDGDCEGRRCQAGATCCGRGEEIQIALPAIPVCNTTFRMTNLGCAAERIFPAWPSSFYFEPGKARV